MDIHVLSLMHLLCLDVEIRKLLIANHGTGAWTKFQAPAPGI